MTNALDVAYVHAEHGNSTQFAISASAVGYVAFREILGGNRGYRGARLDLCLVSDLTIDLIEAKYVEFDFEHIEKRRIISSKLNSALNEVRGYSNSNSQLFNLNRNVRRVGVSFVSPFYGLKSHFDENKVYDLLSYIREEIQPDVLSWSFPHQARNLAYWNRVHPGTILVAKQE